jgi:uncharacterized protein YbjT (DUF2867 family)
MYVVSGATGQVGSAVARALLKANQPVRVIVRSEEKGKSWKDLGCEVAIADILDYKSLIEAYKGAKGLFLMTPPNFDPEPGFPQIIETLLSVMLAINATRPEKIVFLSTVGAHVEEFSLLNNSKMAEETLRTLDIPVGFLRAAWFMENSSWDVGLAKEGTIPAFLQPLDHPVPMVATKDIGAMAAKMLQENWYGKRIVELEGPQRYSADDIGNAFAKAVGHPVEMKPVPRDTWEELFRSQGMQHPMPRIRMIDGFNEGWIDFEKIHEHVFAKTPLDEVIAGLI